MYQGAAGAVQSNLAAQPVTSVPVDSGQPCQGRRSFRVRAEFQEEVKDPRILWKLLRGLGRLR
jgi:hypothetical protein